MLHYWVIESMLANGRWGGHFVRRSPPSSGSTGLISNIATCETAGCWAVSHVATQLGRTTGTPFIHNGLNNVKADWRKGLLFLSIFFILIIHGLCPAMESYVSMEVPTINGRPYAVLQTFSTESTTGQRRFSIFTPTGKNMDVWEAITTDRVGPVFGVFTVQSDKLAPDGVQVRPERLGLFHEGRATVLDFSKNPPVTSFQDLPFKWIAETAAEIDGITYAFGAELPAENGTGKRGGPLRVAQFDGQKWSAIKLDGPLVQSGNGLFSLKAVKMNDGIKVLWRSAEPDQLIDPEIEGPRAITSGLLKMATFNGRTFVGETVAVSGLPRGNTSAWASGANIRVLVQTRTKIEEMMTANGPMEIWDIDPDGKAGKIETMEGSQINSGLLSFIAAERFTWDGQELFLRSNWQKFEIWHKTGDEPWRIIKPNFPELSSLETLLLELVALSLGLVAFGTGMAYRRRKQTLSLMRKIQAHEIYASLGLRMCAYAVDLGVIFLIVFIIGILTGGSYMHPGAVLPSELTQMPYLPFLFIYLSYLVGTEWLTGSTLGKYIMGLRVVMDSGQSLSFWAALVRNLVGFFERLPQFAVFVAMPMIIFSPRRQRLGDILSRTFVVHRSALEIFKKQRAQELAHRKELNEKDEFKTL